MSSKEPNRLFRIATLLAALAMVAVCALWIATRFQNQAGGSGEVAELLMDEQRAANVPVVLCVELLQHGDGSKYHWPTVKVLDVIKNDTADKFSNQLRLAHYGWGEGVPSGRSTIYLVRYNDDHPEYGWKLDESMDDSKVGFSHHTEYDDITKR